MSVLKKIIILLGMLCLFGTTKAQQAFLQKPVTVNYNEQRLSAILADLSEQYAVSFSYSSDEIHAQQTISIRLAAKSGKELLDALAAKANLQWLVVGKQIILKPRKLRSELPDTGIFQTVRGVVVDKESRLPIIGASVQLVSLNPVKGSSTNASGEFRFTGVPVGRQAIRVTAIGYQPANVSQLLVNAGKELVLSIELTAAVTDLPEVTISSRKDRQKAMNDLASVSARSFTVEETGRYAGGFYDPARMAQSFAGVTSANDLNNDIVIRGNSPKGLQWRLEGVEIINPNHFGEEGSSSGGISMISSGMLGNSDFFTGAFPAEYGNALSGVFDLRFRKGNTGKREYAFMVGLLGTEASAEGPFRTGGKASYLVNYRYSTLGILDKLGVSPFGENKIPVYQDLAFNLNFPTQHAGTFSLFGIGGKSKQNQHAVRDSSLWEVFDDRFDRSFGYNSGSAGLKHELTLNDKAYLKNIVSVSYSKITDNADTLNHNYQPDVFGRDVYINSVIRYSSMLNRKVDAKNTIRSGVVISAYHFDLRSRAFKRNIGKLSTVIDAEGNAFNPEIYTQWKHRFSNSFSVNTGVHASYLDLSSSWSVEPRLGLNWWFRPDQQLSFGAGIHSRLEPIGTYFGRNELPDGSVIVSNSHLSPTRALHVVGGYEKHISNNLKFKAEAYYQHLFDVPVSADPAINFSILNAANVYFIYSNNYRQLVNSGTGRNAGVELTLERSLNNGYYFLLTSSVFDSRFETLTGKQFNTDYNSNYAGNLVAGKEWKTSSSGKNLFGLNTKLVYTGGRRYSQVNLEESQKRDENVIYEDRINTLQAKPYMRIDLSASYRVNREKLTHIFYADIQNLTNRRNELAEFYDSDKNRIERITLAGLIPTVNYRIEF